MSLQTRLAALITAIGADVKLLQAGEMQLEFGASGAMTVRTGTIRRPIKGGTYTIVGVTATLGTAPTGATTFKVDVNKNGTTIFTTQGNRPIFTASTNITDSGTPDVTSVTDNDYITVDIDAIGSTVGGSDLSVIVRLRKTA